LEFNTSFNSHNTVTIPANIGVDWNFADFENKFKKKRFSVTFHQNIIHLSCFGDSLPAPVSSYTAGLVSYDLYVKALTLSHNE